MTSKIRSCLLELDLAMIEEIVSVQCYGVKKSAEMTLAVQLEANLPAATAGKLLMD